MLKQIITVKGEGVYDHPVADMIALLSGFPEGSEVYKVENIWNSYLNRECVVGFHKETLGKCGNDNFLLLDPDLIVIQIMGPPEREKGENEWKPTDKYKIMYGKYVNPACFSMLEVEIAKRYDEMSARTA